MDFFHAHEIYDLVTQIYASGNHPVPRSTLNGVRLRHVCDAIKIRVTQIYLDCLENKISIDVYESLKIHWPPLLVGLPVTFARTQLWESSQSMSPADRRVFLMAQGAKYMFDKGSMNEEELEFYHDETFESFLQYLERVARNAVHPFEHVLGHLSRGIIYYDDLIPAMSSFK